MVLPDIIFLMRIMFFIVLAVENFLIAHFFYVMVRDNENLDGFFRVFYMFFFLNGFQYVLGIFINIFSYVIPDQQLVSVFMILTFIYVIPMIWIKWSLLRKITKGDITLSEAKTIKVK